MAVTTPEFSRPQRLDTIGAGDRAAAVEATEPERSALARRFGLTGVERLIGAFTLRRDATGVRVAGRVTAAVVQPCSVTGEPLRVVIAEPVDLLFTAPPAQGVAEADDDIELDDASIDVVFHDGSAIDLGEVAAETMALALDPFPRGPGADAALKQAGVLGEGEGGPFGALAALLGRSPP